MRNLILVLGLGMVQACGMQSNLPSNVAHNDKPVNPPTNLAEIKSLFDAAAKTGDMHDLLDQVGAIDTLYIVPVAKLRQDIGITPGFGQEFIKYVPISGQPAATADEQLSFDLSNQGIAMLHNFNYIEAVRSFEQALRINPNLAEAKIFLAISYPQFSGDINGYLSAAKELAEVSKMTLSPALSAWFKFAQTYVFSGNNAFGLQKAYTQLMSATGNKDIEVMTLAGWASNAATEDTYKNVLKISPNHIGANHYLNHLYEFKNDFQGALPYAKKLADVSVNDWHAQHMYGHVLPMVGKLKEALVQFQKADKLQKDWAAKNNYDIHYSWHPPHNDHLMGITYLALGQTKEAGDTLLSGCEVDFRACDAAAKMAVMELDATLLGKTLALAKNQFSAAEQAGVEAYFDAYQAQIDYISGVTNDSAAIIQLGKDYQSNEMVIIGSLKTLKSGTPAYQQVLKMIDSFFTGGGFDSWTGGYPNAMIVRLAAEKFNQPGIVSYIDQKIANIVQP